MLSAINGNSRTTQITKIKIKKWVSLFLRRSVEEVDAKTKGFSNGGDGFVFRNGAVSGEAPKPTELSLRPVLPSGRSSSGGAAAAIDCFWGVDLIL